MGLVSPELESGAMVSITAGPNAHWGDPIPPFETGGEAEEGAEEASTVLYFPQFISGEGAATEFFLVNNCWTGKEGSIVYYSSDNTGEAGEVVEELPWVMEEGGVLVPEPYSFDGGGLKVGAIELVQEGSGYCSSEGTEFFNALGSYTTVNGVEPGPAQQVFAMRGSGRNTGFAVYNPTESGITLRAIFRSSGADLEAELELGPKGHRAMFLDELFPEVPEGAAGTLNFFSAGARISR